MVVPRSVNVATSAVRRGRERRPRTGHRHVRQTVAVELATALHHSARRQRPVVEEPSGVEVDETNNAQRGQKQLPPARRAARAAEERPYPEGYSLGKEKEKAKLEVINDKLAAKIPLIAEEGAEWWC